MSNSKISMVYNLLGFFSCMLWMVIPSMAQDSGTLKKTIEKQNRMCCGES